MEPMKEVKERWEKQKELIENRLARSVERGIRAHGWDNRFGWTEQVLSPLELPKGIKPRDLPWRNMRDIFTHEVPWWKKAGAKSNNALAAWIIEETGRLISEAMEEEEDRGLIGDMGDTGRAGGWIGRPVGALQKETWKRELLEQLYDWEYTDIKKRADWSRIIEPDRAIGISVALDTIESLVADAREFIGKVEARVETEGVLTLMVGSGEPTVMWCKQEGDGAEWGPPVELPQDLKLSSIWSIPEEKEWWREVITEKLAESWGNFGAVLLRSRVKDGNGEAKWGVLGWQIINGMGGGLNIRQLDKHALAEVWQCEEGENGQEYVLFLD